MPGPVKTSEMVPVVQGVRECGPTRLDISNKSSGRKIGDERRGVNRFLFSLKMAVAMTGQIVQRHLGEGQK
jgi:hypothetical protein